MHIEPSSFSLYVCVGMLVRATEFEPSSVKVAGPPGSVTLLSLKWDR
jgi:hypothetical protein